MDHPRVRVKPSSPGGGGGGRGGRGGQRTSDDRVKHMCYHIITHDVTGANLKHVFLHDGATQWLMFKVLNPLLLLHNSLGMISS